MDTVVLLTAVITVVVPIRILTNAEGVLTAIVTVVVPVGIDVFTIGLAATIVALVIQVLILAGTNGLLTAIVTVVVLVAIVVLANGFGATVVTVVVLVGIAVLALRFAAAIVTDMILVGILVAQGRDHFVARDVLLAILAEDTGFVTVGGTGGRLAFLFHGVFVVAVHDGDCDGGQFYGDHVTIFIEAFALIHAERNGVFTRRHFFTNENLHIQQNTGTRDVFVCRQQNQFADIHIKRHLRVLLVRSPCPTYLFTIGISDGWIESQTLETGVLFHS